MAIRLEGVQPAVRKEYDGQRAMKRPAYELIDTCFGLGRQMLVRRQCPLLVVRVRSDRGAVDEGGYGLEGHGDGDGGLNLEPVPPCPIAPTPPASGRTAPSHEPSLLRPHGRHT